MKFPHLRLFYRIADDLDIHMDKTTHKMNFVSKKLSVLLKTNGKGFIIVNLYGIDQSQLCTIMLLTGILMILIFLVVIL